MSLAPGITKMLVMVNDFIINNYWEAFLLSNNPLYIYYYYLIIYMSHKKTKEITLYMWKLRLKVIKLVNIRKSV